MILRKKKRARLFYRYFSNFYDDINPLFWNEEMRSQALELFSVSESDTILDVGCGTGFATEVLVKKAGEVHGLDITENQILKAIEKDIDAKFLLGDAENLPYKDRVFDAVWSSGAIEYFPDPVKALREIRRVTKNGGQVLIVGPKNPKNKLLKTIANSIMLFYDEKEAEKMLRDAGWSEINNKILSSKLIEDEAIVTTAEKK